MRDASTTARTEEIILQNISPNARNVVLLEIDKDKNGTWEVIDDLDSSKGIDWTVSGKKEKYANYGLTPLPGTVSFNIVNKNGKYSDGSGTSFEGIVTRDSKIRLQAGPLLSTLGTAATDTLTLNDTSGLTVRSHYYHTAFDTSYVKPDAASITEGPKHFRNDANYTLYDSVLYDSDTYSLDAYTVQTWDSKGIGVKQTSQFTVDANNTKGKIYYRELNDYEALDTSSFTNWTYAADTVDGTQTVAIATEKRFLQIGITYDGISYSEDLRVTEITVTYSSYVEFLYKSVYYLDRPKYTDPKAPAMPEIKCSGRDAYKRAVDTDINIQDLADTIGTGRLDEIVKDKCDDIGIDYTATSIADLSGFTTRTLADGVGIIKADKLFNYIMQVINTTGYQMYMEYDDTTDDNVLFIQPKPTTDTAVTALNYKNYESISDVSKNTDRTLKRVSVLSNSQAPKAEEVLDTQVITTTGIKSFSWTGAKIYTRIAFDTTNGDLTGETVDIDPTALEFNVLTITGSVFVTIYGCDWNTEPDSQGEAIDFDNMKDQEGLTSRIVNPLVVSDAECKAIAESFQSEYGNPFIEARGLKWPYLDLRPEINDLFLLWRRFIFTNDIFFVTKITYHWDNSQQPNEHTIFNLEDTGLDRGDPFYDDGITKWDQGWVWDMAITTPLNTQDEIDTISEALEVHNVDCS